MPKKALLAAVLSLAGALSLLLCLLGGFVSVEERAQNCEHALSGGADQQRVVLGSGPQANAHAVVVTGQRMGIPPKGIIVALMTALQESGLRNLANPNVPQSLTIPNEGTGHDHLSVGIMQQQPWWGAIADLMNPSFAAQKFYAALLKIGGWQQMPPTVAAQSVQRSAYPDAYAKWEARATALYNQYKNDPSAPRSPPSAEGSDPYSASTLCGSAENQTAPAAAGPGGAGALAASLAIRQAGLPYVWGGGSLTGPTGGGFDCSGLVRFAVYRASNGKILLPRTSEDMWFAIPGVVPRNMVQAGDLVFSNWGEDGRAGPGHVVMVVNPTTVIAAPYTGRPVEIEPFPKSIVGVKRVFRPTAAMR